MDALKWVIDNKEWLFSGAAVAIIVAIVKRILSKPRQAQKQRGDVDSRNIQAGRDVNITDGQSDFFQLRKAKPEDSAKIIPYEYVSIGIYQTVDNLLAVDIQAKIVLGDKIQPDIQNFLNRIALGEPYCPTCHRPLDLWRASWMADFGQIGYECPVCNFQRKGPWPDLRNDVFARVRSDYDHYWEVYKTKIHEITGGKPEEYNLPS